MVDLETASLTALCGVTFLLGLRHGFDADHLAVIDGIARLNAADRPLVARYSGALFSLGHGVIVIAGVCAVALLASHWQVPAWLEWTGAGISIAFLLGLGIANLRAVWTTPSSEVVRLVGMRSRLVGQIRHPAAVLGIGMLFAFSFDTLSQATLMAVAGTRLGGIGPALAASLCFVAGMLATDGINGLFISGMLRGAQRHAAAASRAMGISVGLASLAVGLIALGAMAVPSVGEWTEEYGLWLGIGVVLSAVLTFAATLFVASPARAQTA